MLTSADFSAKLKINKQNIQIWAYLTSRSFNNDPAVTAGYLEFDWVKTKRRWFDSCISINNDWLNDRCWAVTINQIKSLVLFQGILLNIQDDLMSRFAVFICHFWQIKFVFDRFMIDKYSSDESMIKRNVGLFVCYVMEKENIYIWISS